MRTILPVTPILFGGIPAALVPWDRQNGNMFALPPSKIIVVLMATEPSSVTIQTPMLVDGDLKVESRVIVLPVGMPFLWPLERPEVYKQDDGNVYLDFVTPGSIGIWLV